jgi:hypothetical protein
LHRGEDGGLGMTLAAAAAAPLQLSRREDLERRSSNP